MPLCHSRFEYITLRGSVTTMHLAFLNSDGCSLDCGLKFSHALHSWIIGYSIRYRTSNLRANPDLTKIQNYRTYPLPLQHKPVPVQRAHLVEGNIWWADARPHEKMVAHVRILVSYSASFYHQYFKLTLAYSILRKRCSVEGIGFKVTLVKDSNTMYMRYHTRDCIWDTTQGTW